MLDAKAVPAATYVAYGTEHCSQTSGNVAEGARKKIGSHQVRECEAVYTC